jgi:hypothetical protein
MTAHQDEFAPSCEDEERDELYNDLGAASENLAFQHVCALPYSLYTFTSFIGCSFERKSHGYGSRTQI